MQKEGVKRWINAMKYTCVMGNNVEGDEKCLTDDFVRCFKITATNSLKTKLWRIKREKYKHQLVVQDTRGEISDNNIVTVDGEGELPKRMKEAMTRKDGYVFKVQAVEGRKNEGTGGIALKIMASGQESYESGVGRHDLEEMV